MSVNCVKLFSQQLHHPPATQLLLLLFQENSSLSVISTKKHFWLQLCTVLALQAQIDLSLEVQENVLIPVTNTLKIVQYYENLSIITAAKSTYLRASLSTDHPSSYNSILPSSRVRSQQVPILYDLLVRSATKLISTSNLCHRFSTNTNQNSVWTNPYRLICLGDLTLEGESILILQRSRSLKPIMNLLNHLQYWQTKI